MTGAPDQSPPDSAVSRRRFVAGAGGAAFAVALGGFLFSRNLYAQSEQSCPPAHGASGEGIGQRGAKISFSRHGSGPPILLLHAGGLSRRVWDPVVEILAERYDVLVPDLPGFGQSLPLAATPNIANFTGAVASWLREIGVEWPHVVGNSFGGAIALELGFRGAARSVIALSPIGFWNTVEQVYTYVVLATAYSIARSLPLLTTVMTNSGHRPLFLGVFFARPDDLPGDQVGCALEDIRRSHAFLEALGACSSYRVREQQTDIPVTVAWGVDERMLIGPQHRRARRILPGATHILLPRCGHVCMADDPDLVAATIEKAVLAAAQAGSNRMG
jgi:pimeloyl-ACP methyl ester carboxylesterase